MKLLFKARLLSALLISSTFTDCKKDDPYPAITVTQGTERHLAFESLVWVFEKDTNLATTVVEIPNRYALNKIETVMGLGMENLTGPVVIPPFSDSIRPLYYVLNGRQITISKYYDGMNRWELKTQNNAPFENTIAYYFFILQRIGFTTVEVNFR